GITGLWQVEARDNPSFEAYRRLDLFYVENWSITLDLIIIIGTVEMIVSQLFRTILPQRKPTRQPEQEPETIVARELTPTAASKSPYEQVA
ncbi:MAG: sugar transferase, partial [Ilumatobacteraceae bacterium]